MNMCFEWCLARAHKAQEIDPLLEKLTHLSGLKGQRTSGGATPPFWKREMKERGNFNSFTNLTERGQSVGHIGQMTCEALHQLFPNLYVFHYLEYCVQKISSIVKSNTVTQALCFSKNIYETVLKSLSAKTVNQDTLPCSTARYLAVLLFILWLVCNWRVFIILFLFSFDVWAAGGVCGAGYTTRET